MNAPKELMEPFLDKIAIILNEKKVKKIKIFTSCEAEGSQAEVEVAESVKQECCRPCCY